MSDLDFCILAFAQALHIYSFSFSPYLQCKLVDLTSHFDSVFGDPSLVNY
jgi:hypothetical protein